MKQLIYSGCCMLVLPVWLLAGMQTGFSQQTLAFTRHQVPASSQDSGKETMLLREALKLLEGHYQVDIVFGDRIVQNFSVSSSRLLSKRSLEDDLKRILEPTGLKYKK